MAPPRNIWLYLVALFLAGGVAYVFVSPDRPENQPSAVYEAPALAENPSASSSAADQSPEEESSIPPPSKIKAEVSSASEGAVELIVIDGGSRTPIPGARVRFSGRQEELITDQDGVVAIRGLKEGPVDFTVRTEGYLPKTGSGVRSPRIDVKPGRTITRVFEMQRELGFRGVVIDENDQPVEGAQVKVEYKHTYRFSTPAKVDPAITNDEGKFRIGGLEGGRYSLGARKEGFAPSHLYASSSATEELVIVLHRGSTVEGTVKDFRGAPLEGFTVELRGSALSETVKTTTSDVEGRWKVTCVEQQKWTLSARKENLRTNKVKDLQIGWDDHLSIDLVLQEGVNLSGHVVDSISGEGLANLKMELVAFDPRRSWIEPQKGFRKKASTRSEGEFTFTEVPTGHFRIQFADAPKTYLAPGRRQGIAVTVAKEDSDDLRIRLRRSASVRGRVLLPSGEGAAGASLVLSHSKHDLQRGGKLKTDTHGDFELGGLHHGVGYRIVAFLSGYGRGFSETFNLQQGESIDGIVIHLSVPGSLSGNVKDGEGLPPAKIYRVNAGFTQVPGHASDAANTPSVITNDEGHYELRDLPPGRVLVELSAEGRCLDGDYGCWSVVQKKWVEVRSGEKISEVDFTVLSDEERKRQWQKPLTSHISGRLISRQGEGLAGLPISVQCVSRIQDSGVAGKALSLGDGSFWIGDLIEGTFRLQVNAPGWVPKTLSRVLSPSSDLEIPLDRYASLAGRVVVQKTGDPVRDFVLRHGKPGGKLEELSVQDAQGRFALERLSPGPCLLRVEAQGAGVDQRRLELKGGASVTDLVLVLRPWYQLNGRIVRRTDGMPVGDATVTPSPGEGTTSAPDGSFTAEGVYPGTVSITVTHPDFGTVKFADVPVPEPGRDREAVLQLDEPGRIEGRVYDPSGRPWEGVILQCGAFKESTDYQGFLEFPIVAPGTHTVEMPLWGGVLQGAGTWKQTITVSAGQTTEVRFGERGTTVRGAVFENEEPKALAVVTFKSATTERWLQADRGGEYEVYGLPAGNYKVTVNHPGETYVLLEKTLHLTGRGELQLDLSCP